MYTTTARKPFIAPLLNPWTIATLITLAGALVYVVGDILQNQTPLSYLLLLMLVQLSPFLVCFSRQHYNYIAFILFNHFATHSLPKYNELVLLGRSPLANSTTILALQQLIICTILILGCYQFCRHYFFYRYSEKEHFQMLTMSEWQLAVVAAYVVFVPLFMEYIPPTMLILHFATVAADMVLLLSSNSPGRERMAMFLRIWVFISTFYYFLNTGMLMMVGNLAGYIFIAACLQKNYKRVLVPIILAIAASGIQNVKSHYRTYLVNHRAASQTEKVTALTTLVVARYVDESILGDYDDIPNPNPTASQTDDKTLTDDLISGYNRAGDDSLERVLSWTPSRVPFWNGESYAALPFMLIPRALWPDKPSRHIWMRFGRTYGYLGDDDFTTSVSVSFIAEGYMNFGYPGMYGVCLFFGFLVALVERLSYYFLRGYYYFSFMVFLMPLLQYSSDLTTMVNSVIIVGILLMLFRNQFLLMARRDDYV